MSFSLPVRAEAVTAPLYPAFTFCASPTYNKWVRLTVADVHALRPERGFEGQNVYFYLNHPIRFVRIIAPIVTIDDLNPKYTFFTLDDGSGKTIEVKIKRVPPTPSQATSTTTFQWPTNTEIPNLHIDDSPGVFNILVDGNALDVGTVVKVLGTLSEFRDAKQLQLARFLPRDSTEQEPKRIAIVSDTNQEVEHWNQAAEWKLDILSKPWKLSAEKLQKLQVRKQKEIEENRKIDEKFRAHKSKKRREYEERLRKYERRWDRKRREDEAFCQEGALPGTN